MNKPEALQKAEQNLHLSLKAENVWGLLVEASDPDLPEPEYQRIRENIGSSLNTFSQALADYAHASMAGLYRQVYDIYSALAANPRQKLALKTQ